MGKGIREWWRYGVAAVALGFLAWYVGPSALLTTLRDSRPSWLILYFLSFLLVPVLYGLQLLGVLRLAGYKLPMAPVIGSAMQSWSIGTLTPARAGDFSLSYFLGSRVPEGVATAAVTVDKLLSLFTLAVWSLAGVSALSLPHRNTLLLGITIVLGGVLAALAIVRVRPPDAAGRVIARRWLGARGEAGLRQMHALMGVPRVLAWCLAATALRWLYICCSNVLIFHAVDEHPPLWYVVAATAVGRVVSLVPLSVGGVGIKEPVQIVIYRAADVPAEAVLAVSLLGLACGFVVAAIAPLLARTLMKARTAVH